MIPTNGNWRCETCIFWIDDAIPEMRKEGKKLMTCHRNPPTYQGIGIGMFAGHVRTAGTDSCGEWRDKTG